MLKTTHFVLETIVRFRVHDTANGKRLIHVGTSVRSRRLEEVGASRLLAQERTAAREGDSSFLRPLLLGACYADYVGTDSQNRK